MTGSADVIQIYREMLKLDRSSRVFALLAEGLCAAGEWEEAAEVCKKGLLFHPDHLRSRVLLGWALIEMGEADESKQILLEAVEDIRKNTIIFKLLSELFTFSGEAESAREYARIYETFQTPGIVLLPPEPDRLEPVSLPKKETSVWDDFKAEAIEELQGSEVDTMDPDTLVQPKPEMAPEPKIGPAATLTRLAQRIEARFTEKAQPAAILSEDDKKMIKQKIIAVLNA
jgi:hypothetical protein